MRIEREHKELLRYVHFVVAILIVAAVVLLAHFKIRTAREAAARDRLEAFHLRSLVLTGESTRQLATLLALLSDPSVEGDDDAGQLRLDSKTEFYVVDSALKSIAELQRSYRHENMARTVERALEENGAIHLALESAPWDPVRVKKAIEGLDLTLFQLNRLHSTAAEDMLHQLTADQPRRLWTLILAILSVCLVTGILLVRMFRLLRKKLESLSETRNALLHKERQLQQALKMDALGTLAGGIAHDFNNLLTAILGNAEVLLLNQSGDDSRLNSAREIQMAGEKAAALTRQLLLFSRQEVAEPCVLDLNHVILKLEPLLRRLIREDISLTIACDPDPVVVEADPTQMEQVIINLIVNAKDSMPTGGVVSLRTDRVSVSLEEASQLKILPGAYSRISVKDSGSGIPPGNKDRVLEPFFTTKERDRGTGLGLSTVDGIVKAGGGGILLNSEMGRGTTFDIYLPKADKPVPSPATAEAPGPGQFRGTETILLVEDEAQVRRLTANGLQEAGYSVVTAADGDEAIRCWKEHQGTIDLVLTDVILPKKSGPDLARQICRERPEIGLVYISGYAEEELSKEVKTSGRPLLPKPYRVQDLVRAVRAELDRSTKDKATPGARSKRGGRPAGDGAAVDSASRSL